MQLEEYFNSIRSRTDNAYELAEEARNQSKDPEQRVDIPVAEDLPEKASSLVTAAKFPGLKGSEVPERIRELEDEFGKNDERVSFQIAAEIAQERFCEFDTQQRACDAGIRVGVSYMTGGITTAPLEGISDVKIRENDDGTRYLSVYYAGPIRSAGGTASAMSVLLADYVRKKIDLDRFKPSDEHVKRYAVEVEDYYNRVTTKQYTPDREEVRFIAERVPVEVTGGPTRDIEVSSHKDMEKIDTNQIRGGMCLVYLDGLPLKAPKIKKRIKSWGEDFNLQNWSWIEEYLDLQKKKHSGGDSDDEEGNASEKKYTPSDKYLGSLTAGRPIFAHPGRKGGFRLRYGHTRVNGLAAVAVHPATMEVTQQFAATGTQLKTEYPGKATITVPCDTIHPPVVRMQNGEVTRLESRNKVQENEHRIDEILFLGDMLVPYGEFVENGKDLLPSPFVEEWWQKELNEALNNSEIRLGKQFDDSDVSPSEAWKISDALGIPLHPDYSYHWSEASKEGFSSLFNYLESGDMKDQAKKFCENCLIPHSVSGSEIQFDDTHRKNLVTIKKRLDTYEIDDDTSILEFLEAQTGVEFKEQAPHYIGARMGRPEKAEKREIQGKPQILFPCGKKEGGRMRNLVRSYEQETVTQDIIHNIDPETGEEVHFSYNPKSGNETEALYICGSCGNRHRQEVEECSNCGNERVSRHQETDIPVKNMMDHALENLDMNMPELLKSVRGMSSKHKHVEPIEKGLLRQKHDLFVNKDGTVRYDATDLPMTHFKPSEINVSVNRLRDLGYHKDANGNPLTDADQVCELKPQDIVVPDGDGSLPASDFLLRTAKFIDDLLENFYGLEPHYEAEDKEDLIGALVIGLAPHTSGGTVGRIIGFTDAKGIYSHPYWHAAKRRNCDGDEDAILLLMDGLLNFSRQFLPDVTGARTMDAPLILSTVINPDEVDDEAWALETVDEYPLEFYHETQEYKPPWELECDIEIGEDIVYGDEPFDHGYTHEVSNIENAPMESEYVTLGDMSEKTSAQLGLGEKLKSVDEDATAELLLKKHFIPDIKGNLRSFSSQEVRCVDCNTKFRRVPIRSQKIAASGKTTCECPECGGDILLTISEGTIRKYMRPSKEIIGEYEVSSYTRQEINSLDRTLKSLFGNAERQSGLTQFTG